jgi:hypothetical protein
MCIVGMDYYYKRTIWTYGQYVNCVAGGLKARNPSTEQNHLFWTVRH